MRLCRNTGHNKPPAFLKDRDEHQVIVNEEMRNIVVSILVIIPLHKPGIVDDGFFLSGLVQFSQYFPVDLILLTNDISLGYDGKFFANRTVRCMVTLPDVLVFLTGSLKIPLSGMGCDDGFQDRPSLAESD